MDLQIGTNVVFAGVGVVRVEVPPPALEVADLDGDKFEVDAEDYDLLRPIVSEEEATRLFERLLLAPESFSQERESKRSVHYLDVYDSGTPDEQVDALRAILHDQRNEAAETQNQKRFEELVFNELAVALGVTFGTIRSRLAKRMGGSPAPADLLVDRSAELPSDADIPSVPAMQTLGAIWVDAEIGAGAEGVERTATAASGVWFAYGCTQLDGADDDMLVAVHAEHGLRRWLDGDADLGNAGGPVPVEGATLCVADVAAASDARFTHRMATLGGDGVFDGRAVRLHLGGDGSCQVQHHVVDGRAVGVVVRA